MPTRYLSLLVLTLAALFAALGPAAGARAADKKPSAKAAEEAEKKAAEEAKKAEEEAKKRAKAEFDGKAGEVLKEAYILMNAANKDYGGHCGKAQHEVQEACKLLDENLLKNGSVAQKIKAMQEDQAAAGAKALNRYGVPIKEGQAVSDALLLQAGVMLKEISGPLAAAKYNRTLGHVKKAMQELELALAVR
jgi:hypothetical protein